MIRYVLGPKSSSYVKDVLYLFDKNTPNCSISSIVGLSLSGGGVNTGSSILLRVGKNRVYLRLLQESTK